MSESNGRWKRLVAEGAVIVISILLAFGIDAAWDQSQERAFRADLLELLRADFEATLVELDRAQNEANVIRSSYRDLLEAGETGSGITADSIRILADQALSFVAYRPELAAYETAVASGGFRLINVPELWRDVTRFLQSLETFEDHSRLYRELVFVGDIQGLRGKLGSLLPLYRTELNGRSDLVLSDVEIRAVVGGKEARAAFEAAYWALIVVSSSLEQMNLIATDILKHVERP